MANFDPNLSCAEAYIAAYSSTLEQRELLPFNLSTPNDIARVRASPAAKNAIELAMQQDNAELKHLVEIEANIQRLILKIKRRAAETFASLAPVASCPPEILGHIFWIFASDLLQQGIQQQATGLIYISGVSRKWRDIALSLSKLWTNCLVLWPPEQQRAWLERSAQRLLDINFAWKWTKPEPREQLPPFCEYSSRWRSIHSDTTAVLPKLLPLAGDLHNLQTISINNDYGSKSPYAWHDPASRFPALTSLHMCSVTVSDLRNIAANLVDLSLLDTAHVIIRRHQELSACCNLRTLTLGGQTLYSSGTDARLSIINLPELRELSVKDTLGPGLSQLVSLIRAPKLEKLELPFRPAEEFVSTLYVCHTQPEYLNDAILAG